MFARWKPQKTRVTIFVPHLSGWRKWINQLHWHLPFPLKHPSSKDSTTKSWHFYPETETIFWVNPLWSYPLLFQATVISCLRLLLISPNSCYLSLIISPPPRILNHIDFHSDLWQHSCSSPLKDFTLCHSRSSMFFPFTLHLTNFYPAIESPLENPSLREVVWRPNTIRSQSSFTTVGNYIFILFLFNVQIPTILKSGEFSTYSPR
jgi:hypothetical protein